MSKFKTLKEIINAKETSLKWKYGRYYISKEDLYLIIEAVRQISSKDDYIIEELIKELERDWTMPTLCKCGHTSKAHVFGNAQQ